MTATIRYAFRDDPLNAYMMTEGVTEYPQYVQIMAFRKREVALSFLPEYFFIDSKSSSTGQLTKLGQEVQNKHWANSFQYVARVDAQLEVIVRRSLFEKISQNFYPLWTPDVPLSFFGDQPSGFIVFLRVFRVRSELTDDLLAKGRMGSSQIFQLYDNQTATSVPADILEPVISDNKFEYVKEEIVYLLKKENALIAEYPNTSEGIQKLQERVDAAKILQPKTRLFNPGSDIDMAQIDYPRLYADIKSIAPSMSGFVEYVSEIKPAQIGETDYLMPAAKAGDYFAKERIIEMNMRSALRYALWYHNRYGIDLEDATNEALSGIIIALQKYDPSSANKFTIYCGLWMRQIMNRNLHIGEYAVRFPVHMREKLRPLMDYLSEHDCYECRCGQYCKEAINEASLITGGDELDAIHYLSILSCPSSIDEMLDQEDALSDNGLFENKMIADIFNEEMRNTVADALLTLKEREGEVLKKRYGIRTPEMTLAQIGQEYSLTRERIRQIEAKAIRKMRHPVRGRDLKPFWEELEK